LGWIDTELVLVALAAALSPTTLTFSVLTLVLGERPLRTGFWFYLGALGATLGIGVVAAFVLGNHAASTTPSSPKTWVAVLDIVFALALIGFVVRWLRKPANPAQTDAAVAQVSRVVSSRAVAIIGAGAALANPGMFIPIALKTISELDPSTVGYVVDWLFFSLVSLLPLGLALIALLVAPTWAERVLQAARGWLERNVRIVAAVIVIGLAAGLLRNGIAGLTS
jgi:Sap, sulfolipid-1-addressing protein